MAEEKTIKDLKDKAEEEIQARDKDNKETKLETPLEEVKRIAEETKKVAESNRETMARLEEINANITLSGRSQAGQTIRKKTQEDIDQEEADKMINQFT